MCRERISNLTSSFDVIMPICKIHIVTSCLLYISFTKITLDLCLQSWKGWSYNSLPRSTEATYILPGFFFLCEYILTNKDKTMLADLSCQRQQALFCLASQGNIMVLLFANMIQIFMLLKNPNMHLLPHSAELFLYIMKKVKTCTVFCVSIRIAS